MGCLGGFLILGSIIFGFILALVTGYMEEDKSLVYFLWAVDLVAFLGGVYLLRKASREGREEEDKEHKN